MDPFLTGNPAAASVPAGFVIRLDGTTVYVVGDTALFGDMDVIGGREELGV